MATKKELVEAQSFSRRRLLTAFVSGAPGGRELEPTSPVRGVVAGLVLAALVVAGGLGSGLLNRGLPKGWENGQIIVVKDNAARYVSVDGALVPVTNMASARLLVEPGAKIMTVSEKLVRDVERLPRAGIVGAPDSLPDPDDLVQDSWRACLAQDGSTAVAISAADDPAATGGAADPTAAAAGSGEPAQAVSTLARVGEQTYLVQGARSYLIPASLEQAGVVRALGFTAEQIRDGREGWLALFASSADIVAFEIEGAGGVPAGALGQIAGVSVGTVVTRDGSGESYVALADGRLARLNPFSEAVYATRPATDPGVVTLAAADLATIEEVPLEESPVPSSWPTTLAQPIAQDAGACAQLDAAAFGAELVSGELEPAAAVSIKPGTGALALFVASAETTEGPVRFIDENGIAYAIEGGGDADRTEAITRLFPAGGKDPVVVPYAWGDLFTSGPTLSVQAAQESRSDTPEGDGEAPEQDSTP